jgi:hypothetical protein
VNHRKEQKLKTCRVFLEPIDRRPHIEGIFFDKLHFDTFDTKDEGIQRIEFTGRGRIAFKHRLMKLVEKHAVPRAGAMTC